ncbi:PIN domain-containing protein [Candidatus Gottesmanbacteria bacterium]|nr:PIN domain-containing protein [Candidatus Gottesmanbacteria bacterium]
MKHARKGEIKQPDTSETNRNPPVFGAGFTKALAREIVRNLANLGAMTAKPFQRTPKMETPQSRETIGDYPIVIDTSILIDGRILPIVNSGFIVGTLVIPQVVLGEVQHIADSADAVRRAKGRRGLDVAGKLKGQKANPLVKIKVVTDDAPEMNEVDHKLTALAKRWDAKLMTVDFNLAQYARAQGVKVLNVNDLAQALKMAIVPGEELTIKITHAGKEREQGVGYLSDGTMIVVDQARSLVGQEVAVVIMKIHQTPAGQLFFGRLK